MGCKIAVVGATGRVGREVLSILAEFRDEKKILIDSVIVFASQKSKGKKVSFGDEKLAVSCLEGYDFAGINIAIFCAGYHVSEQYVPIATWKSATAGCTVIDNSSHFRMKEGVPLVFQRLIKKNHGIQKPQHNIQSELHYNTDAASATFITPKSQGKENCCFNLSINFRDRQSSDG